MDPIHISFEKVILIQVIIYCKSPISSYTTPTVLPGMSVFMENLHNKVGGES